MAITRWCSARADTVGRNDALVAPRPWMQISGSPSPAWIVEMSPTLVFTARKASRVGSSATPLVAARKPTPTCRSWRMVRRPRWKARIPPRTSRAMAFQLARSAVSVASARPRDRGSSTGLRRPLTTTSQVPTSGTFRRTRVSSGGRSSAAMSKRSTRVVSALGGESTADQSDRFLGFHTSLFHL